MRFGYATYFFWMILVSRIAFGDPALAQTRLGLHVTQEELNIWRQRAQSGPYKTAGDVSTNSPGDWNRMVSYAGIHAANPLKEIWQGQTAAGAWAPDGHSCNYTAGSGNVGGCVPLQGQGEYAMAAAFVSLVQPQNFNHCPTVRQLLIAQIAQPGTDFTNAAKWPNEQLGDAWSGTISVMFTRLAYAYDYCRIISPGTFSASDRTNIETWFSNAAFYWGRNTDHLVRNQAFPNRNTEFDTTVNVGRTYPTDTMGDTAQGSITYYDCTLGVPGPLATGENWNNRSTMQVRFAVVGSMLRSTPSAQDLQSQRWAKMWFKEWITYATFANNMVNDYWRNASTFAGEPPTNGWQYMGNAMGTMSTVADIFARAGDTSLYDFETSSGRTWAKAPAGHNGDTAGGPKSLKRILQRHASFVNHRATGVPGWIGSDSNHCGDARYLIQPVDNVSGEERTDDTRYAHANIYYKDNNIKLAYTRQLTGAPQYPQNPVTGFNNPNAWGGGWWEFNGILFMFGQMEGKIWPYGGTSTPPPPPPQSPPTTSAIMVDSTFPGYSTSRIDDGIGDAFGGTATTWASAESSTAPHWIEITLPSSQQINTATIHWAYNDTAYMTSQEMQVEYWNGSSFVTAATMTWPGKDVPSTTVTFSTVTTSKLRFYQSPNQGHPSYPEVIWLAEIDYGTSVASTPGAPTNLLIAGE